MLEDLLEQFDISLEDFRKKGRCRPEIVKKRSDVVTHLHERGLSWAQMTEITGLSIGSIQRLSRAKGNPKTKEKISKLGKSLGASWKGKSRGDQLNRQWVKGDFESLKGRVRPQHERDKLKEAWKNPELRERASEHSKSRVWGNPETRDKILAFHRSPEERSARSLAQAKRMQEDEGKYLSGRRTKEATPKGNKDEVLVRSSYEAAAIRIFEEDILVKGYVYEPRYTVEGRTIIPDFLVDYENGSKALIEVKASWALKRKKTIERLALSEKIASDEGYSFHVWCEKELGL